MKKRSIYTTKFSQINKQNVLKISKNLLGLFAVGLSLRAGFGCTQRAYEATQQDRATIATLVDTKIIKGNNGKNHIVIWLDSNKDQTTIEGHCSMFDVDNKRVLDISALTNGTTKSLAEWRRIAHPYAVQHNPSTFLPSR